MVSRSQDAQAAQTCELRDAQRFGAHIRSLRRVRGLTQEQLAGRSDLSPDTIRRLEHGAFQPSLETISKVCRGLALTRSTLFESLELPDGTDGSPLRELNALASMRSDADIELGLVMLRALFRQIDQQQSAALRVVALVPEDEG